MIKWILLGAFMAPIAFYATALMVYLYKARQP